MTRRAKSALSLVDTAALWWLNASRMKSKVVAILETRTGAHLAELVARRGGMPMLAPAWKRCRISIRKRCPRCWTQWRIAAIQNLHFSNRRGNAGAVCRHRCGQLKRGTEERLAASIVVVRGPKPVGELNARGVRIDIKAASPFTTDTVFDALADVPVAGARFWCSAMAQPIKRWRGTCRPGARTVQEIATYRWALPADTQPLLEAARCARAAAASMPSSSPVPFRSTISMRSPRKPEVLRIWRINLNRSLVASIGPVCSRALRQYGVAPTLEAIRRSSGR